MADYAGLTIWTDAYIGDTTHLTLQEHGAYFKLLLIAWRSPGCCLPDDDKRLSIMLGVTLKVWLRLKPVIMEFWKLEDGLYYQGRLTREREKVEAQSRKGAAAANKRWAHKSLKSNNVNDASASPEYMPDECPPSPSPTPIGNPSDSDKSDISPLFGGQAKKRVPARPKSKEKVESGRPDKFEEFWNTYPHRGGAKKGKVAARKKWDAALKRKVDPEIIIEGARDFTRDRKVVDGYAPDPARWLFNEMWQDEIEEVRGQDNENGNRNTSGRGGTHRSGNGGYHDALMEGFGQAAVDHERGSRQDGFDDPESDEPGHAQGHIGQGGSDPH